MLVSVLQFLRIMCYHYFESLDIFIWRVCKSNKYVKRAARV